jgi:hypothetical protein
LSASHLAWLAKILGRLIDESMGKNNGIRQ